MSTQHDPVAERLDTPPTHHTDTDGRTYEQRFIKRACNGCGTELGDAHQAEIDAAVVGQPLPDVRGECPVCDVAGTT